MRISGVGVLPQTPPETKPPIRNRMTLANKDESSLQNNVVKKQAKLLSMPVKKKVITPLTYTPPRNSSRNASFDNYSSFLQKAKEINEEEKVLAIVESALEKIAELSPPNLTPVNSIDNSALHNDNILCFEGHSVYTYNEKKEDSKATVVTNVEEEDTEFVNLLEMEIEKLQIVRQHIEKKNVMKNSKSENNKTLVGECNNVNKTMIKRTQSPETSPIISMPLSVIKSTRSPTYKIPKKNSFLRKEVISKSRPNVSKIEATPMKNLEGKALNMYLNMKNNLNFLSTPIRKRDTQVPNTPAIISKNLQNQLDKLFGS